MNETPDVTIENQQMRLVVTSDGIARSLVYKPTGTECLIQGKSVPFSTITEPRPYQNEVKLAYPNRRTTFKSNAVRMEGDKLVIGYELIPWEATVSVKIADDYIAFTLEAFTLTEDYGIVMTEPPISEMWFLRLPVRELGHWGDWLNVIWDDEVAVNVLAAGPCANADSEEGEGYRILQAGSDEQVKLTGVTAALITCAKDELLDKIDTVERDYGLPHGVASRRHDLYTASYYWASTVTPASVDEHIKYARMGGFRLMNIYYPAFLDSRGYRLIGNYDVYRREYPNGKADLKAMLTKIKEAGITPGCHFLHSHIGRDSKYVTPAPDHRLNLLKIFTLAEPLSEADTTIHVEQNPIHSTMAGNRRVLKIGTELISYEGYTTTPPYTFHGCVRGIDSTTVNAQPVGYMFGLLDVSEFGATSVYLDQYSGLQDEVADGIADLWDAGFEFIYFDGSEGVNPPFWHHVANAQYRVFSKLKPEPILAEGAAKTHFSWHMLTGGNAFDVFPPEKLKEETLRHPFREAPRMRDNFTRLNFGWLGYWLPSEETIGTQPDQLEFVTSKAAAWDCPVSIQADPAKLAQHPRSSDNFEVFKRWEEVRARKWLSDEQKQMLRDEEQEFILLLDERNDLELVPYDRIMEIAGGSTGVIAFTFERKDALYAVYWHISADAQLELPLKPQDFVVLESMGVEIEAAAGKQGDTAIVPVGKRRYLKSTGPNKDKLTTAFGGARVLDL
ncbi:MAG: hypothetical protein HN712_11865 [Gemmatimonadetes bacterium]|jgi:hypothetical protein|nr:hypothetical protein [Gemmatimonadota bacterium]MBT7861005.1 hypothetical protein [Gemmatimonadota bacterium]